MKPRKSGVINTLNEEKNLCHALRSVQWADEPVVADMYSTDRTVILLVVLGMMRLYSDEVARFWVSLRGNGSGGLIASAARVR
jgi:hypothetical protein